MKNKTCFSQKPLVHLSQILYARFKVLPNDTFLNDNIFCDHCSYDLYLYIRKMLVKREMTFCDFSLYFYHKLGCYRAMKCALRVYV